MNKLNVLNNLLVSIKNGYSNKNKYAYCKLNFLCINVLWALYKEELIYDFYVDKLNNKIQIRLKYFKDKPIIKNLNLISKPSLIVFSNFNNLKKFSTNYDYFFISTSNGVISSAFANKNLNVGGIILFGLKLNI
jgi:small subunit ribosomal protein S8